MPYDRHSYPENELVSISNGTETRLVNRRDAHDHVVNLKAGWHYTLASDPQPAPKAN